MGFQKSFIYGLQRNGVIVDQTSIDEKDPAHARYLFYKEFGHKKQAGDKIVLIRQEWD